MSPDLKKQLHEIRMAMSAIGAEIQWAVQQQPIPRDRLGELETELKSLWKSYYMLKTF